MRGSRRLCNLRLLIENKRGSKMWREEWERRQVVPSAIKLHRSFPFLSTFITFYVLSRARSKRLITLDEEMGKWMQIKKHFFVYFCLLLERFREWSDCVAMLGLTHVPQQKKATCRCVSTTLINLLPLFFCFFFFLFVYRCCDSTLYQTLNCDIFTFCFVIPFESVRSSVADVRLRLDDEMKSRERRRENSNTLPSRHEPRLKRETLCFSPLRQPTEMSL